MESEAEDSGKETADPECKSSDGQIWKESPKAKTKGSASLLRQNREIYVLWEDLSVWVSL